MTTSLGTSAPPRPRLAIRVGVTGHRPNKLREAELPTLRQRVGEVLAVVKQVAREVAADDSAGYSDAPPLLGIVSALAEGADRIVAQVALGCGFELQVALPCAETLYQQEFAGQESVTEYERLRGQATVVLALDGTPRSPAAYEAVGRCVVRHCDLLVAVWDGQEAAGRGGTADVVRMALEGNIPTIRIDSRSPNDLTVLGFGYETTTSEPALKRVERALAALLRPPQPVRSGRRGAPLADLRNAYFAESRARGWLGHAHGVVVNLLTQPLNVRPSLLPNDYEKATADAWRSQWRAPPAIPDSLTKQLEAKLLKPYAWADHLAIHYANLYRSAFTLTYLLAPLAVLAALRAYFLDIRRATETEHAWVALELAALLSILAIYWLGRRRLWHERWLDYRSLAERLRHLTYLLPLARTTPAVHVPAHAAGVDPRATWVDWYLRAVVREVGLFAATMGAEHASACRALLKDKEIGDEEIGQIAYHTRNAERMRTVHRHLHPVAVCLFAGALAAALGHLLPLWAGNREVLTELAALLPVLGGSLLAFLGQSDFQNMARRSAAMRAGLLELKSKLEHLTVPATAGPGELAATVQDLGDLAEETAEVMGAELIDWRVGFEGKPLVLPG